ncbi:hypothetical protein ZMTM_16260 [Methyloradius palustris]|uniref:diguanylate cyclase n=2 Tax=Methyloradius palustris TaxID=2778876 RepID=A0A8D5G039_9PROT|nr:hypothetical protein ZMTM_16260 [Methyloradius palustris]
MNELENQATVDLLSGALTRRHFHEVCQTELARSLRYQYPISIAYIDLDNFKSVNDKLGHGMGDKILVITAAAIKANLREGDLFGRLGGDEFALLLINTNRDEMEIIMNRMRESLMKAISLSQTEVTYSIGAVTYLSGMPITIHALLEIADEAMYAIKNSTKNSIKFVSI